MNRDNYVVKANKFIEAKGKLGTLEQKLLAALISQIQIEDKDFKEYRLKISEVGEFLELNNNAIYERLRETANNLKNRSLSLEEVDPETNKKTFIEVNLIASARHTEGSGMLIITIAPDLKPYLLAIKGEETPFTKYMIKNILKLNNSYSIRFYELLKQYERKREREFEIEKLKEFVGADLPSYHKFSEFERRVLKPAKTEINEKTDIWMDYQKIKEGRKITKVIFTIDPKFADKNQETLNALYSSEELKTIKNKCGFAEEKFNDKQVMELYEIACEISGKFNIDIDPYAYINLNFEYMLKQKDVKNRFAYLKKALEEDFASAVVKIVTSGEKK